MEEVCAEQRPQSGTFFVRSICARYNCPPTIQLESGPRDFWQAVSVSMHSFVMKGALVGGLLLVGILGRAGLVAAQERPSAQARAAEIAARADSLRSERQFAAARQAFRRARDLYQQSGSDLEAASVTGEIGVAHYLEGNLDAALKAFQSGVSIAREAGAEEERANFLNNIGLIQWRRGQYDAALTHLRQSAQIHREAGNRERVGQALNNIANIQEERGEYQAALQKYRAALRIARGKDDSVDVASYLNNIGLVLRSQGRYDEALRRHERALALHRALGERSSIPDALNNIGLVWKEKNEYERALETYREALDINRALDDQSGIVTNLNNVGELYQRQGRTDEAIETLQEALRIGRKIEDRASVAITLNDLGAVHWSQGAYERALALHRRSLRISRSLGRSTGVAAALDGIGQTYLEQGQYRAADSVLQASIAITDTLIQTASGADRRDFLAQEIDRYHTRVMVQVRAGTPEAALRTLERSRTRVFARRLAEQKSSVSARSSVPPVDSLQRALGPQEAALLYANTDAKGPITAFVVTRQSVEARELDDTAFLQWARRAFAAELRQLQRREDDLLAEAKGVDADETLSSLVRLYRRDLAVSPSQQLLSDARRRGLARELYSLLIGPLRDSLGGVDELVVVPDGALAYLPFETLRTPRGDYLVEHRRVQYSQSLRVMHLLRQRTTWAPDSSARRSLLALGGAVYDAPTYAADSAAGASTETALADATPDGRSATRTEGRVALGTERSQVGGGGTAVGATTRSYRQLGYGPERWYNLGGTLREVRALGRIVGSATLLVGENASEQNLRRLSATGALDDYRALHIAAHGFVVPETPSLSALVLSEVSQRRSAAPQPSQRPDTTAFEAVDGYLNMREIARLDLNAEFVALSACETGLGRIYRGSGSVSLAQAFLRAGAGAVAVSLWPVYDASTSRFMQGVYRRAWWHDTSWAEAIADTKRAFVEGDYGKRLQAPRFWAPFVYYGREGR